ncbi:hypothetical protein [Streptomyces pacificus]|uniref:Uncharacterized protein n=1 Tax=Streptomyces pacificus TaxID=2705029 RepID=A0A6A0ASK6_9ACTN|nr:hypothetical protein [Streptomyces pacificus]GFH35939.1 hypothetical protein SCWH03_21610 [Streptomyces pacificus]
MKKNFETTESARSRPEDTSGEAERMSEVEDLTQGEAEKVSKDLEDGQQTY